MYLKWILVILTVSTICCVCQETPENNLESNPSEINNSEKSDAGGSIITNIVDQIVSNLEKVLPSEGDIYDINYKEPLSDEITLNSTVLNETNVNVTQKAPLCKPNAGGEPVEIVNGTQLIKILLPDPNVTNDVPPAKCVLILFYATFCTFSSMAAPHFNALSRAFPDVKMVAIDAMKHHVFNTQNGIVGVPTLLLFYNGKPIGKFNETEYTLDLFSKFISKYTRLQPIEKSYVTSADFAGPVPSTPEKETDYFLGISWLFIIVCAVYYFSKSRWWKWIVETIQNTWRESEAQHEHND